MDNVFVQMYGKSEIKSSQSTDMLELIREMKVVNARFLDMFQISNVIANDDGSFTVKFKNGAFYIKVSPNLESYG
jgi:hypothetical protein